MKHPSIIASVVVGCGLMLTACTARIPYYQSFSLMETELHPKDIILQGPTQGSDSAFVLMGFAFEPDSFLQAEQAALVTNGSDVLVDRVRYTGAEGLIFPLGDFVIVGSRTYYVEGTGAKLTHR